LVFKTSAKTNEGLETLCIKLDQIVRSKEWIIKHNQKQKQLIYEELKDMVLDNIKQKTLKVFDLKSKEINEIIDSIISKNTDPYTATEELSLLIFSNK
jgi:putative protein kinase ArgK-like GTPase of G3E family